MLLMEDLLWAVEDPDAAGLNTRQSLTVMEGALSYAKEEKRYVLLSNEFGLGLLALIYELTSFAFFPLGVS